MDYNCKDTECPLKKNCKRSTDKPKRNQKYYKVSPRWKGSECDSYFPDGETPEQQREAMQQEREEKWQESRSNNFQ